MEKTAIGLGRSYCCRLSYSPVPGERKSGIPAAAKKKRIYVLLYITILTNSTSSSSLSSIIVIIIVIIVHHSPYSTALPTREPQAPTGCAKSISLTPL
jgi:hypothetical protein